MHERHRVNAMLHLGEDFARVRIVDHTGLQTKKARRHLKVVLHTMMNFAQQRFFFAQRRLNQFLGTPPIGDVAHDTHHE